MASTPTSRSATAIIARPIGMPLRSGIHRAVTVPINTAVTPPAASVKSARVTEGTSAATVNARRFATR